MIRTEVEKVLIKSLESLQREGKISSEVLEAASPIIFQKNALSYPENQEHGDYATPLALQLAKQFGIQPHDLAELIAGAINNQQSAIIARAEVAGPGFVNIFLSPEILQRELSEILKKGESYGSNNLWKGKKIIVEFTDPNPFKEFHIGHLYSNTIGEVVARFFEASGAKIKRANYQGDVGMHVAKAIWGLQKEMEAQGLSLKDLEKKSLEERMEFLGSAYAKGAMAYEDNAEAAEHIKTLNAKIFTQDKSIKEVYDKGRNWSLEYFENIYRRLGTNFDFYYFESKVGKTGEQLVRKGLENGIFQESEGAIIFPGEQYGLHSRVFINSQGLPTYEAKELGLAPTKYKDFPYDLSVVVTGNEIIGYFKVVLAALEKMHPELAEKTQHIPHGMVRLPEGKMSSRTGSVIAAEDLLEEVGTRAKKLVETSGGELSAKEKEKVAEQVTIAAVKYSLLRVGIGKDIIFDFEKSLSLDGDSGPYLQYTYARCKSILRKAKGFSKQTTARSDLNNEELAVLRSLQRFSEVVTEATKGFSPNLLCNFVFDVAQVYNTFYNKHSVLQADSKEEKEFRLMLTAATAQVIKSSLFLLGIQTPEKM